MPKLNQRGFIAQLLLLLLLGAGLAVGIYLVQNRTGWFSKAAPVIPQKPETSFELEAQADTAEPFTDGPVKLTGVGVGAKFRVDVWVRSDIDAANLFAAKLKFDPGKMQVVEINKRGSNSFIDQWITEPSFDNSSGEISIIGGVNAPGLLTAQDNGIVYPASDVKGVTAGSPGNPIPPPLNPKGYLDSASCDTITGWTCDGDDHNKSLRVDFYANGPAGQGVGIGSVTASLQREAGVAGQCGGNSQHGFTFSIPKNSLRDGKPHDIYAYGINIGAGKHVILQGSPKSVTCESETVGCAAVITPAKNPTTGECKEFSTPCDVPEGWDKVNSCKSSSITYDPKGYLDPGATCEEIKGWTCDGDNYNEPLRVDFYANGPAGQGVGIGSVTASLQRVAGVAGQCGGNSSHGFSFAVPKNSLRDGKPHQIYAYGINTGKGSNVILQGSPQAVTCIPPQGSLPTSTPTSGQPTLMVPRLMASIIFEAKKAGDASIEFADGSEILRNSDSLNIISAKKGLTLKITETAPTSNATCDVNAIDVPPDPTGRPGNPLAVQFVYSAKYQFNNYMTAAQWDFDGDDKWDTDMSLFNGMIVHNFSKEGVYNPKLRLQMADGGITPVCSKKITVPLKVSTPVEIAPQCIAITADAPLGQLASGESVYMLKDSDKAKLKAVSTNQYLKPVDEEGRASIPESKDGGLAILPEGGGGEIDLPATVYAINKTAGDITVSVKGYIGKNKDSGQCPEAKFVIQPNKPNNDLPIFIPQDQAKFLRHDGDINSDGKIDLVDMSRLLAQIGQKGTFEADLNSDQMVNVMDVIQLRNILIKNGTLGKK